MDRMTITEALAEIHVLDKRLQAKHDFVMNHSMLDTRIKDPLGDTSKEVAQALQAIGDLENRRIVIRQAIAHANAENFISVGGRELSIANWLVWKREVGPSRLQWLKSIRKAMERARQELKQQLTREVPEGVPAPGLDAMIDEKWLSKEIENLEEQIERLDGQMSLKNATVFVEV